MYHHTKASKPRPVHGLTHGKGDGPSTTPDDGRWHRSTRSGGQEHEWHDATDGHTAVTISDFIMDVAGGHHGLGTAVEVLLVQTSLDSTLAVSQFLSYDLFHSKSLRASGS